MTDFVPDPQPKPPEIVVSKFLRALADDLEAGGEPIPYLQSVSMCSDDYGRTLTFEVWCGKAALPKSQVAIREALSNLR